MTLEALTGCDVVAGLGSDEVSEERVIAALVVGNGLAVDLDDAGGRTGLGLVGRSDFGTKLGRFKVLNLNGTQLGDALVEGIGSGLEISEVLVLGLGQVAGFVGGTGKDAVDSFGKFCSFFDELIKQTHGCAFLGLGGGVSGAGRVPVAGGRRFQRRNAGFG